MPTEKIKILAHAGDEKRGYGEIEVHHFSPKERIANSLKKLMLFWGLAAVCVLIPGLHFVLVPLFLIVGIYFFQKTYKIKSQAVQGHVNCPACQKNIVIGKSLLDWPLTEICQNCVTTVRIQPEV